MRLEWSALAMADRKTIFDSIETDSPRAAVGVDDRIESRVDGFEQFPLMGRPGRIDGTRELVTNRTPYIVAYRIDSETIRILRVLHGAQRWPETIPEDDV
jgi:addiction module RelE/StbE family toxin